MTLRISKAILVIGIVVLVGGGCAVGGYYVGRDSRQGQVDEARRLAEANARLNRPPGEGSAGDASKAGRTLEDLREEDVQRLGRSQAACDFNSDRPSRKYG